MKYIVNLISVFVLSLLSASAQVVSQHSSEHVFLECCMNDTSLHINEKDLHEAAIKIYNSDGELVYAKAKKESSKNDQTIQAKSDKYWVVITQGDQTQSFTVRKKNKIELAWFSLRL